MTFRVLTSIYHLRLAPIDDIMTGEQLEVPAQLIDTFISLIWHRTKCASWCIKIHLYRSHILSGCFHTSLIIDYILNPLDIHWWSKDKGVFWPFWLCFSGIDNFLNDCFYLYVNIPCTLHRYRRIVHTTIYHKTLQIIMSIVSLFLDSPLYLSLL